MKINKFLKMLVLSAVVVSSLASVSVTGYAAPPGAVSWEQNASTQKSGYAVNELGTKIITSRDSKTGLSLEINPKTGKETTRYTDSKGKGISGLQNVSNGKYWYIFDEKGFATIDGYLVKDGKTYRTDSITSMGITALHQNSNGKYFYLKNTSTSTAPYCVVNTWIQVGGDWYYFDSTGLSVINTWIKSGNDWYYLGTNSKMVTNTTINGYKIGADGKWIQ